MNDDEDDLEALEGAWQADPDDAGEPMNEGKGQDDDATASDDLADVVDIKTGKHTTKATGRQAWQAKAERANQPTAPKQFEPYKLQKAKGAGKSARQAAVKFLVSLTRKVLSGETVVSLCHLDPKNQDTTSALLVFRKDGKVYFCK